MKTFIQKGEVITCVSAALAVSGMITMVGSLPVVPVTSAEIGDEFEGATTGVFEFPKTLANVVTVGAKIYLKADGTAVTTTATANYLIGVATKAQINGDTTAQVRLNGVATAVT